MNKEVRIQKIRDIKNHETPIGKIDIPWKDRLEPMEVYQIPLAYLIYNKYNGRILSRTKSYENQNLIIDAENENGKKLIEDFLWNSKEQKNKETLASLGKLGQEKVGIITEDGIIIDGNRRAMLLNRIDHIDYFKAVVLPVTYEGNPLEIEKFETKYQLGEERKLDYNPIEIYLKIQSLYIQLSGKSFYTPESADKNAIKKIYEWVGNYKNIKSVNDIEFTLSVMNTMDEYLEWFNYNGIYTTLDEREEQFRGLTTWILNYYGEGSNKPFDNYTDSDVDDLKTLCYDLIRIKYKNEKFRYVAQGLKQSHFFGNKEIWDSFQNEHRRIVKTFDEPKIDINVKNLEVHLDSIDSDFKNKIGSSLDENVDNHYQKLRNKQSQDEPEKLISKALDSFNSINQKNKNFTSNSVQKQVEELGKKVFDSLQKKSPSRVLSHIIELLEDIDVDKIPSNEVEELKEKANRINQISYQIKKNL
ncbi:hypothetical protein LXD69_16480 [Flavobacterium sediminilitoris]|uniref:ParB/Sulfiredoxin domain-containing protein n=1 Tax=Flavobacterium sediminilitoris TaxID=2024526 RepID=A0ABY4HMQ0_9FLAO|nr:MULTISPECIES: hypothetical protein [Flavobacterium]UOX33617.1 hypothetical protein LXD69_16480 [Flavobacterium sediminilitoris]